MIEVKELASPDEVKDLKQAYLSSLPAPLDGMWESGFIAAAPHWEIRFRGERAGYYCVSEEGQLLQLHVIDALANHARELFSHVSAAPEIKSAIVSTAEPVYLSLCLDLQKRVGVHTYLYHDHDRTEESADAGFGAVEHDDLDVVEEFQRASLDADLGAWLTGYLRNLQARGELFALRRDGELVGTGECRVSDTQPPYADLGVIVSRSQRGRGIATHILRQLKAHAYRRELEPICSTTVGNPGAQKAIVRAGFVSRHRILEVGF